MKKIFFISLLIFSFYLNTLPVRAAAYVPDQALTVVLNRTDPKAISVSSIAIDFQNPELYMVSYLDNYYTVILTDASGTELFKGQASYVNQIITINVEDTPGSPGSIKSIPSESVTLNLPYFTEAKYLKVFDEKNVLLLNLNLATYGIGTTERFADCDQCGYCKGGKVPQSWEKCRTCLYPSLSSDALTGETLRIDPDTGSPIKPAEGTFYTDLGCISSPLGFTTAQGPAAMVRSIMSLLYTVTGAIGLVTLMYGAFLVTTSKGNASQVRRGKHFIVRTIIGVVIVFSAVFLVNLIAGALKIPGFG